MNKGELIENIQSVLLDPRREDKTKELIEALNNNLHKSAAIHHEWYKQNFNSVDLHNRYWYKLHYGYKVSRLLLRGGSLT